jgi:hypothetical protein
MDKPARPDEFRRNEDRLNTGRGLMLKRDHKKAQAVAKAVLLPDTHRSSGQAAIELAVFGAILIFVLGTIVRSAVGNSYSQNQNFKAMRMAMLASWNGSKAGNTSHNTASILFVEDRLSPDLNKYGDLERNPFVASGSGTFTYELLYPVDVGEAATMLPIQDVYINGQHFPFTTASYVTNRTITRSTSCSSDCQATTPQQQQCLQNQINRNAREWVGGTVAENIFENIIPVALGPTAGKQMAANASTIFQAMATVGLIANVTGTDLTQGGSGLTGDVTSLVTSASFISSYANHFPGLSGAQLTQIQSILQSNVSQYKLFYSLVANGEDTFSPTPPVCANPTTLPCKDKALSPTLQAMDANGNPYINTNGDMEYDLLRLGNYAAVEAQFPTVASCSTASMRCNIAWQWSATAATTASQIGLDASNSDFPAYDIDGRLKTVTIYTFSKDSTTGYPTVSYEDFQGGDIDGTWDINSCGPKPGLQNDSQIFTFTKNAQNGTNGGTYLQILEGKLYNPETGQFVRSVNKRDTIDLIQRSIQLSNNTGRFCPAVSGGPSFTPPSTLSDGSGPNPVEVCIPAGSSDNCFSSDQNIKSICFDENDNLMWVRSRLEDRSGNFWITNASGKLKVR